MELSIRHINDELSYITFCDYYIVHNLTEEQTENILGNLEVNSWILRTDNKYKRNFHAITIKTNDGFVHHNGFLFKTNFQVHIIKENKTYETMKEYILYLSKSYGFDINKQIIYEND
jgi:hypothetical protein